MKLDLPGSKEDLIQRCPECDYCIFEDILPEKYRKIKVLDLPIPKRHIHRITIEEICGKEHDEVCPMKYAAMRSMYDDFMATQLGAIKIFVWDLGKVNKRKIDYEEGMRDWSRKQDLGKGIKESYAERFREVWDAGLRKEQQTLTSTAIYERVIANPQLYAQNLKVLERLKQESKERDLL